MAESSRLRGRAAGTKGADVATLTDAVRSVVVAKDGNVFGRTAVFLEGRRTQVRSTLGGGMTRKKLWIGGFVLAALASCQLLRDRDSGSGGEPQESAASGTEGPATAPTTLGHFRTRHGTLTVLSTADGERYTVRDGQGNVLASDLTANELLESHPEYQGLVDPFVGIAGLGY